MMALYADGVNVHAFLMPRTEFRQLVEGSTPATPSCTRSSPRDGCSTRTTRPSPTLCERLREIGARDRRSSCCAPRPQRSPRSTRRTNGWSRAAISTTPRCGFSTRRRRSPQIEVIGAGRLADREVIPQALTLNPAFFTTDLHRPAEQRRRRRARRARRSTPSMATSRTRARRSSRRCSTTCATPARRGRATEIEDHFTRHFDVGDVTTACEYLADQGLIGKVSLPARLTKKSNVDVQELAFFYLERPSRRPDDATGEPRCAAGRPARRSPSRARASTT